MNLTAEIRTLIRDIQEELCNDIYSGASDNVRIHRIEFNVGRLFGTLDILLAAENPERIIAESIKRRTVEPASDSGARHFVEP